MKSVDWKSNIQRAHELLKQACSGGGRKSALTALVLSVHGLALAVLPLAESTTQQPHQQAPRQETKTLISETGAICGNVEVRVLPFKYTKHFDASMKELRDMRVSWGAPADIRLELGFVKTERIVKYDLLTTEENCKTHVFSIGYAPALLYVASDLSQNNCAFNHVLRHEEKHIAIYKNGLEGISNNETIKRSIEVAMRENTANQAINIAKQVLHGQLDKIRYLHEQFDSDDEYQENSRACSGSIRRIAMRG